jgi:hypothetical protein
LPSPSVGAASTIGSDEPDPVLDGEGAADGVGAEDAEGALPGALRLQAAAARTVSEARKRRVRMVPRLGLILAAGARPTCTIRFARGAVRKLRDTAIA